MPAKEEEETAEETTEDLEEEVEEKKDMADVADWEGMEKRIQNLEDAIASLKGEKMEDVQEEEMSNDQAPLKSRTIKEEFSEVELSEEVKPIKHNPEAKATQKKQVQFAKGKFNTTFDRVLNRLNK